MATRKDYTDREGLGKQMIKRGIRLTEEENEMLNELLEVNEMTLRDFIASLIEEEYIREMGGK